MRFLVSTMMLALLVSSAYAERVDMGPIQSSGPEIQEKVTSRYIALIYCPAQKANNSSYTAGDEEGLSVEIQQEETFIKIFAAGRLYKSEKKENMGSLYTVMGNKDVNDDELLKGTYVSADTYYGTKLEVKLSSLLSDKTIELSSDGPDVVTGKHQSTAVILKKCTVTYYNKL